MADLQCVASQRKRQALGQSQEPLRLLIPFYLGTLELLTFPILIRVKFYTAIGAWISPKTLAQWFRWKEDRLPYDRYLIGNGLVILASWALAWAFVAKDGP